MSQDFDRKSNYEPETFQPRVEAEEGDPTRGDYVIGAVVAVVVIVGLLWAAGLISPAWLP